MTDPSRLFGRRYRLRVENTLITDLDINFTIERTLKRQPNTAEINVINLSPDSRAAIEEKGTASVTLEAGYKDRISLIFSGDLRDVHTERDGATIITKISSGDGEKKHRTARVNKSYAPGTTIKKVIRDCAQAMGVGVGNLNALGSVEFPKAGATFPTGTTLSGYVSDELYAILRSAGLEYSIQDGKLQIVTRGKALNDEAIILAPDTGLTGSASVGSDGILHATCLMIPDLIPGRMVKVRSTQAFENILSIQSRGKGRRHLEGFAGVFRAQKCTYSGDTTASDNWGIAIQADPLFRKAA